MTVLDSVVTGDFNMSTVISKFSQEEPEGAYEVPDQSVGLPMGGINRYILHTVVKKDGINMEDIRKDTEEGGVYDGDSDTDGEEYNELLSAMEEAVFEKAFTLE